MFVTFIIRGMVSCADLSFSQLYLFDPLVVLFFYCMLQVVCRMCGMRRAWCLQVMLCLSGVVAEQISRKVGLTKCLVLEWCIISDIHDFLLLICSLLDVVMLILFISKFSGVIYRARNIYIHHPHPVWYMKNPPFL